MTDSIFFSKETISGLNKILLQQSNYQNLSREGKQEIINVLVKNMKSIYKSIDQSRVNSNNFNNVFDQFKKASLTDTLSELKRTNVLQNHLQSPSDLKFQRDFASNPNSGNKLMERPEATKIQGNLNQKVQKSEQKRNEQFRGVTSDMNNYDSTLDQVFRPIVDNSDDNFATKYETGRTGDIQNRMESIRQLRDNELGNKNQRPPTPEFLKPKQTNPTKQSYDSNVSNDNRNIPRQNNSRPDFQNAKSIDFNNGFQGLSNDTGGDLYSLDNIDKPLIDQEIEEDNASFEDRLKRLQSDRDTLKAPPQKTVDFKNENYPRSENDNIVRNSEPEPRQMQTRPVQKQPVQQQVQRPNIEYETKQVQQQVQRPIIESNNSKPNDRMSELKNSMKSININVSDDNQMIKKMKLLIDKLENDNLQLKEIIEKQKMEIETLSDNSELSKIDEIKKQIREEFDTLRNKSEEIENKLSNLNLREVELIKKDSELKQLISNYDYLFKSQHLQMEVTSADNQSSYTWKMEPIDNVIGIRLMTYSLPTPRFNIEENKNNQLKFRVGEQNYNIVLSTGKYTIDELIYILNSKIAEKNDKIKISINNEQRIILESTDVNEIIDIIPTLLSKENLGFLLTAENKNKHISDRVWDLRVDDKVYLYLNNLADDTPFGVLYFNGQSVSQFKFNKPFNLPNLEIVFKDSRGMDYKFHNLPHSLSFLIEKIDN